jgi:hypothetical protein
MGNTTSLCDSVIRGNAEKWNSAHFSGILPLFSDMRFKQDTSSTQLTVVAFEGKNYKRNEWNYNEFLKQNKQTCYISQIVEKSKLYSEWVNI